MSKYIDAERLKAEIEKNIRCYDNYGISGPYEGGELDAYKEILALIDELQQEQPEVYLDKFTEKIDNYKARYKYPESVSVKGAMAFMARMFYQYPNAARQWYEKLPKATMD